MRLSAQIPIIFGHSVIDSIPPNDNAANGTRTGADRDVSRPLPEHELPLWLMRTAKQASRRSIQSLRPIEYRLLARFADDMRRWYCASSNMAQGLEMCIKSLRGKKIGDRWQSAADKIRSGHSLVESLSNADDLLPKFFLPVIEAGEKSGRLDDALEFLSQHCKLMAGPAAAIRNVWLYPVAIMLFGSAVKVLIPLFVGAVGLSVSMLIGETISWLQTAVIVVVVIATPARKFVEKACLQLPVVGELQREISIHRFFRTLALVYAVSGHRVEDMIRTSAKTVTNTAIREEFMNAAVAIEKKRSIAEALRRVPNITHGEHTTIAAGEMSGTLEKAFDQIADEACASMLPKLKTIQYVATRLLMFGVFSAMAGTIVSVMVSRQ